MPRCRAPPLRPPARAWRARLGRQAGLQPTHPDHPAATVGPWLDSLDRLAALNLRTVVPSRGPVHADASGIDQTRRCLQWLDRSFGGWAAQGWDTNEVLRGPVPCSGACCGATWVSGIGAVAETQDSLVGAPAA